MERGDGPYLFDTEGNRYIDLSLGNGAAILGHRHPALTSALDEVGARGFLTASETADHAARAASLARGFREWRELGGPGHSRASPWSRRRAARRSPMATEEGIFVEPASALSLAGLLADRETGRIAPDDSVVCILTGSGFKDRDAMTRLSDARG